MQEQMDQLLEQSQILRISGVSFGFPFAAPELVYVRILDVKFICLPNLAASLSFNVHPDQSLGHAEGLWLPALPGQELVRGVLERPPDRHLHILAS